MKGSRPGKELISTACIRVGQCLFTYPFTTVKEQSRQVHSTGGNVAWSVTHESVVQKADLHEVLADGARLDVIVVRLRDSSQEVHWVGVAEVIVEGAQNKSLGAQNL